MAGIDVWMRRQIQREVPGETDVKRFVLILKGGVSHHHASVPVRYQRRRI
jgi:hypothetical protein